MNPRKLLIRLVLFIFLIFLLNYLAMKFYWYSSIWYLDMPMHFLGGAWLGLAYIYLFLPKDNSLKSIFKIFFDFAGGAFAILYYIRNIMPIYQDKI